MDNAVLNSELIATKAGNITVYNYDGKTRNIFLLQMNILPLVSVSLHIPVWMNLVYIRRVMLSAVRWI